MAPRRARGGRARPLLPLLLLLLLLLASLQLRETSGYPILWARQANSCEAHPAEPGAKGEKKLCNCCQRSREPLSPMARGGWGD